VGGERRREREERGREGEREEWGRERGERERKMTRFFFSVSDRLSIQQTCNDAPQTDRY